MDTNLIDSCREANGESNKPGSDVMGEFKAFKNNGDQMVDYRPYYDSGDTRLTNSFRF
jgi:hypothetical protein